MSLPAEILFHRYFVEEAIRRPDARKYRGRQDLAVLEPSMGSLLANMRAAWNDGLVREHGVIAPGRPRYYVDYVDADVVNALAFAYEGIAFMGLTVPLIRELWHFCESLSREPKVAAYFSAATVEQQQALHVEIFSTVAGFVVCHEYAHHHRSHMVHHSEETPFYNDVVNRTLDGSIDDQGKEIHADGFTVYLVIYGLVIGDRREMTIRNLGLQTTDETLLRIFIMSVAGFFFIGGPREFDPSTVERLTHPPPAIRLHYIMHHVQRWCRESYPSLLPSVTPALFAEILWTIEEVMWGRREPAWPDQERFARSPEGQGYLLKLNAAYDALQGRSRGE